MLEAVAVAVHLQDVDVVGEAVQQRPGEALRSEHLGPLVEGQIGGDQDGAALVALAEDLEEDNAPSALLRIPGYWCGGSSSERFLGFQAINSQGGHFARPVVVLKAT